jgi:hypothetical protein
MVMWASASFDFNTHLFSIWPKYESNAEREREREREREAERREEGREGGRMKRKEK